MEKNILRKEMIEKRRQLDGQEREKAGAAAADQLIKLALWDEADWVFLYCAVRGEFPTDAIRDAAFAAGKRVAAPVSLENGIMHFYELRSREDVQIGKYHIPEPRRQDQEVVPTERTIVLVPGTAFSEAGDRMGYGGGYYDRYLKQADGISIGLAYEFQVLAVIPREEHDVRLSLLVTEERICSCKMKMFQV